MSHHHKAELSLASSKGSGLLHRRVSRIDIDLKGGDAGDFATKKDSTTDSPENAGVFLRFELKNGLLQYQSLMKAAGKLKDAMNNLALARSEFSDALRGVSSCRCSGAAGAVNADQETEGK